MVADVTVVDPMFVEVAAVDTLEGGHGRQGFGLIGGDIRGHCGLIP